jgi:UDPglucose 6-dehydrogenase
LAFKGETDDIRESPAIDLIEMLLAEGCTICAYDPAAMQRAQTELPAGAQLEYATDAYGAAKDADALLVLTDWREFAALDLDRLYALMRYPIVVDGRNLFDPQLLAEHGFTYISIGRPAVYPVREAALATSK